MNSKPKNGDCPDNKEVNLIEDERWDTVLRVLESREFSRAPKLRNFLRYICTAAITQQAHDLHEQQIGSLVFGRRPDYNPAEDNIVRVEARELRKRLDRYFSSGEGLLEPFRIIVPKGTYVPIFEARSGDLLTTETPSYAEIPSHAMGTNKKGPLAAARQSLGSAQVLSLVFLVLLGMAYWWLGGTHHARSGLAVTTPKQVFPRSILARIFPRQSALKVILADSSLAAVEIFTGRTVPLADYWNREYLQDLPPNLKKLAQWPYTSLSDVMVTSKIVETLLPGNQTVVIRYPRDLTIRDIEGGNTIFLGSAYSDPWLHEFDSQTNFSVAQDKKKRKLCFSEKDAKPDGPGHYCAASGPPRITFALVTYLPNPRHTGDVLILEGTDGAGTEAAGDFVTDPYYAGQLTQYLHSKPNVSVLPYFEILMRAPVLDNAPGKLQVISTRIVPRS